MVVNPSYLELLINHYSNDPLLIPEDLRVFPSLLFDAYDSLDDGSSIKDLCRVVSFLLKSFDPEAKLCVHPYFLLHGLRKPTLEGVASKIEDNYRIINETRSFIDDFRVYCNSSLAGDLVLKVIEGEFADTNGVCCFVHPSSLSMPSQVAGYVSKVTFFADVSNFTAYFFTIQSRKFNLYSKSDARKYNHYYHGLCRVLGMDPRAFVLQTVCELLEQECFNDFRVIKPLIHPFTIEAHNGFFARYESLVKDLGFIDEDDTYLVKRNA